MSMMGPSLRRLSSRRVTTVCTGRLLSLKRSLSTKNSQRERRHASWTRVATGALWISVSGLIVVSYQVRELRSRKIRDLPLAQTVWSEYYPSRSLQDVEEIVQRTGLMGSSHSVRSELDKIRKWHIEHGYKGGLIVRDLTKPLFGMELWENTEEHPTDLTIGEIINDPTQLSRREAYYLYYEVKGNGAVQQQIFCRGTTLMFDVLTCLESYMVYDDDLKVRVHKGFRNQADRILKDVLPLLAPPNHPRATVEVAGHSLGGAAGTILALKLKQRGYRVVRVTTVGEPRFCASEEDADRLLQLLPKDHVRVEDNLDFVTFLPPFGSHVGNKLWLLHNRSARFVKAHTAWADSVWLNFLSLEILAHFGRPHRIPSYVEQLQELLDLQ